MRSEHVCSEVARQEEENYHAVAGDEMTVNSQADVRACVCVPKTFNKTINVSK